MAEPGYSGPTNDNPALQQMVTAYFKLSADEDQSENAEYQRMKSQQGQRQEFRMENSIFNLAEAIYEEKE